MKAYFVFLLNSFRSHYFNKQETGVVYSGNYFGFPFEMYDSSRLLL